VSPAVRLHAPWRTREERCSERRELRSDRRRVSAAAVWLRVAHDRQPRGRRTRSSRTLRARPTVALGKMPPEQRRELRLQPWLYTITLNVTRNRLRSKRPTNVALDALADPDALLRNSEEHRPLQPETIVEQNADVAAVERALCSCRCICALPATLRFIEGRSHPEIAEILHQPIGTVKSHVPSCRSHSAPHPGSAGRSPHPARSTRACDVVTSWRYGMKPAAAAPAPSRSR